MAAAIIAAPIVAGIVGNVMGSKDRNAARAAMAQAMAQLQAVGLPPDLSREIIFEKFQSAGIYSPQLEEDIQVASSQTAQIQEDPALREAQLSALKSIQRRGEVGLTAEDRASLGEITGRLGREAEAKRQQIVQSMQQRGQAGSGAELAAQLSSAQQSATQGSQASLDLASMASQRALDAMRMGGQLGGEIRGQDFNVASTKAKAADELAQFVARNSIERQRQNIGNLNQAQIANLANKQQLMSTNTQMANQERLRQSQAQRDYWQDKLSYGQSMANALTGQAQQSRQQAQEKAQMIGGIGSGVGTALGAYAAYGGGSGGTTTSEPTSTTTPIRDDEYYRRY
jgi:hypothetical protein